MRRLLRLCLALTLLTAAAAAQGSSSSSDDAPSHPDAPTPSRLGIRRTDAAGAAITLETNEGLFDLAAALNSCGYSADLANSDPVRAQVRAELTAIVADSPEAQRTQSALCQYITEHELTDKGRQLAQYVSLALFLGPPPELTPTAEQTEMPPDALAVINILPLLRAWASATTLHTVWLKHHAQYNALTDRAHDPVTRMILNTNIYLKVPVSSYDGRRVIILEEPMLAPNAPNGRIYSSDYVLVTSPSAAGAIKMQEIRHLYLQYEVEPLVYARAQSMERLAPLLKPVADAPLEYTYKTEIVPLVTECLIKAIEARTMDTGFTPPTKPTGTRARLDLARYDEELASYDRQAEAVRRQQVALDMREGWVITDYFYNELLSFERNPESLAEIMGQMVYGMDVGRVQHAAQQIHFLPAVSHDFVSRVAPAPTGLQLGEKKMMQGDIPGAEAIADRALADPAQNHAEALYLKARLELLEGDPESSEATFTEIVRTATTPRPLAWAHVYLGRLDDIRLESPEADGTEPNANPKVDSKPDPKADPKAPTATARPQALREYKAALAIPGAPADARAAAESGLRTPFTVPTHVHKEEQPLDPSGKAEKDAYKPE